MPADDESNSSTDYLALLADKADDPRVTRLITAYREADNSPDDSSETESPLLREALRLYEEALSEDN